MVLAEQVLFRKAFNSYQQFFRKQPQFTCAASCFLIATAGYHWEEQRKYLAHRKFFCSPAEWLEFRLHVYNQHLRAISPPLWESGWGSCSTLSSNAWSNVCLKLGFKILFQLSFDSGIRYIKMLRKTFLKTRCMCHCCCCDYNTSYYLPTSPLLWMICWNLASWSVFASTSAKDLANAAGGVCW